MQNLYFTEQQHYICKLMMTAELYVKTHFLHHLHHITYKGDEKPKVCTVQMFTLHGFELLKSTKQIPTSSCHDGPSVYELAYRGFNIKKAI